MATHADPGATLDGVAVAAGEVAGSAPREPAVAEAAGPRRRVPAIGVSPAGAAVAVLEGPGVVDVGEGPVEPRMGEAVV
jgi:hypothetical protein